MNKNLELNKSGLFKWMPYVFLVLAVLPTGCSKDPLNNPDEDTFKDFRDNHRYKYVRVGQQYWMAENLAFLPSVSPPSKSSETSPYYYVYDYDDSDEKEAKTELNYTTYGVLYNWEAAKTACPEGWHLPNDEEWKTLELQLGMNMADADNDGWERRSGSVGKKLKSKNGWFENGNGIDSCDFSVLPGGQRINEDWGDWFWGLGASACFWASPDEESERVWTRNIESGYSGIGRWLYYRMDGLSIRCVKSVSGKPNIPPSAWFVVTPVTGNTITRFVVDANGSSDTETPADRLRIRWDWTNDGIWDTGSTVIKTDTQQFVNPGTYSIRLEVQDVEGLTSSVTQEITVTSGSVGEGYYTDIRDGIIYHYTTIGSQTWMTENLAFLPDVSYSSDGSDSSPYYYVNDYEGSDKSEAKTMPNYVAYGTLYNWEAAKTACPSGWHLPSDDEWKTLELFLGMSEVDIGVSLGWRKSGSVGKKLKNTTGWPVSCNGDNSSGFTGIPGGFRYYYGGFVYPEQGNASFWTSTGAESNTTWARRLGAYSDGVGRSTDTWSSGFSVRCLQN